VGGLSLKSSVTPCKTIQYHLEVGGADTFNFPGLPVGSPPRTVAQGYLPPGNYLLSVRLGTQTKTTTLQVGQCTFRELILNF